MSKLLIKSFHISLDNYELLYLQEHVVDSFLLNPKVQLSTQSYIITYNYQTLIIQHLPVLFTV